MSTTTEPDFARALAGHAIQTGPVSGIWSCIGPCGASSIDNVDGVPTTKAERQDQHRAHLAEVIETELVAWADSRLAEVEEAHGTAIIDLADATDTINVLRGRLAAVEAALVHTDPSQIGTSAKAWLDGETAMANRVRAALANHSAAQERHDRGCAAGIVSAARCQCANPSAEQSEGGR